METTTDYPKMIKVIYTGKRISQKNDKIFESFFLMNGDKISDKSLGFDKLKPTFGIGCIYEINQKSETSFHINNDNFVGRYDKTEEQKKIIMDYSIKNKAVIEASYQKNRIKKIIEINPIIEEICKPLKDKYYSMTTAERQALLAYIIQILTR